MSVRDGRKAPFCWQSRHALAHLRREWPAEWAEDEKPVAVRTGLNVYFALTEIANEHKARTRVGLDSEGFEATNRELEDRSGLTDRAIFATSVILERIGLLEVTRELGKPHVYTLVEPDPVQANDVRGTRERGSGVRETEGANAVRGTHAPGSGVTNKEKKEEVPPNPPRGAGSTSRRRRNRQPHRPTEYRG